MTTEETVKIMGVLQLNYPSSFHGLDKEAVKARVQLWQQMFADDDYALVSAAVMAHIAQDTDHFMPPIGVIKAALHRVTNPHEAEEGEAWAMVSKAMNGSAWKSEKKFAELPPLIQKAVGSPYQLREWGQMDIESIGVARAQFTKAYRALMQREQEQAALPQALRTFMLGAGERLRLGGGLANG